MNVTGSVSEEIKSAAKFYASKLLDGRIHRHVNVEIVIDTNFMFAGLCEADDDCVKPKWFTIKINPSAHDHVLQSLAHEMVHVSQYVTGRLFDQMDGKIHWEGQVHLHKGNHHEDYQNYPWEIEAYGLEEELYEEWLSIEIID